MADPSPEQQSAHSGGVLGRVHRHLPWARGLLLALLLGTAGGALFSLAALPLAWMIGAVVATMVAAFFGLQMQVPQGVRNGFLMILGVLVGSGFTPDILEHVQRWTVSIGGVVLYTILLAAGALWLYRRLGLSFVDSFFASLPGGMAAVIIIGSELGADLRTLALIHSVRIVTVCVAVPLWYTFVEGLVSTPSAAGAAAAMGLADAALLVGCALAGFWLAAKLRIPAPYLLGPLLLSAAVHLTGLTEAKPPPELVRAAQVVVGAAIGCRFVGISLRQVLGTVAVGFVSTVLMLGITVLASLAVADLSGLPFQSLILAYAPGGLPEMTLIALALDIDVAFVVTHHLVRVLCINLGVPPLFQHVLRRFVR